MYTVPIGPRCKERDRDTAINGRAIFHLDPQKSAVSIGDEIECLVLGERSPLFFVWCFLIPDDRRAPV